MLGTRLSTPIHGAAEAAAAWQETLVNVTLSLSGVGILIGTAMVLHGLGRRAARA